MYTTTVLCIDPNSNYFKLPGIDLYTKTRNAYNFTGNNVIIAHPPCAQWSRLRNFAKEDKEEKELALFCWELVNKNGGILEHPYGSFLFKYVNASRKKIFCIDQHWFNFPCRKRTWLYCHEIDLLPFPLNFNAYIRKVESLHSRTRSIMPIEFCKYLVDSVSSHIPASIGLSKSPTVTQA